MAESTLDAPGARRPRGLFQAAARREPTRPTKARNQDTRLHNRSLVLATLYRDGAMSRADLARASGLTMPTVSALVADLIDDGLLVDIGPRADVRRGKPANLIEVDDAGTNLVVVDLSLVDRFVGAVTDLRGRVVARAEVALGHAAGEAAQALVFQLIEQLMERAPRRVLGIGVGSPGIIDDRGVIRQAAHLDWHDLPMAAELSDRFGVPAHVGNDVNVAALAVLTFRATGAQNLMLVSIEHGVGAALVIDGDLVWGEQFAAGEIGHVTVVDDGQACICGKRGCLDLLISAVHLRSRVEGLPAELRQARLTEAGHALGLVLAPILSVLNLNEVVLTGPADLIEGPFLAAANNTARARTLPPISSSLTVRSLAGDSDLTLLGGVSLVLSCELGVL